MFISDQELSDIPGYFILSTDGNIHWEHPQLHRRPEPKITYTKVRYSRVNSKRHIEVIYCAHKYLKVAHILAVLKGEYPPKHIPNWK